MTDINNIYLPLQTIAVPQDNDAMLEFTYQDQNGNLLDLTGVQAIDFVVFTDTNGTVEIEKTLLSGDITVYGNDYQFSVPISYLDTQGIDNRLSYYECRVTNSEGERRTVSAGIFRCEKTYIWSNT